MKRSHLLVAVALATMFVSAACGQSPASQAGAAAGKEIGVIYPLSGPQAPGGREELDGLRTALALSGASVRLQVVDVTTPAAAVAAVNKFADQGITLVAGSYGSPIAVAGADQAERRGLTWWETGAVADGVTVGHHSVFRTVATGSNLGREAAQFTSSVLIPRDHGPGVMSATTPARIAIVAVDDVYGRSVADSEVAQASALGGMTVVDRINYDPHRYSGDDIVRQLLADKPDYLWDVSYIDDGVDIWHRAHAAGLNVKAAIGTSSAFCMPDFGRRLGAEATGLYAADKPDEVDLEHISLPPATRDLLDRAIARYRHDTGRSTMSIPAIAGFVGGWALFHDVVPAASDLSPAAIRSAAFALDIPVGGTINGGGIRFAAPGQPDAGQNLRAPAVVGQWQPGGAMRVVWPDRYAGS